jgi:hypothetical protein
LHELDTSPLATKTDLKDAVHTLQIAFANSTTNLIIRMTGALLAQGALVVAVLQYLK